MVNEKIIEEIQDLSTILVKKLNQHLKHKQYRYQSFGSEIEDVTIDFLVDLLKEKGIIKNSKDVQRARNKNEFPDLFISNISLAIDLKSGNTFGKKKDAWITVKNSNNDLGTLNSWPKKLEQFDGENILFIFIIYSINADDQTIRDIQIDPFYKFLAFNKDGVLRYREKDGNLRPRDFSAKPSINTFSEFKKLFSRTVAYRSLRIIKKHVKNVSEKELEQLLKKA